jgi:protein SCO1/2
VVSLLRRTRRPRVLSALAAVLALGGLLTACTSSNGDGPPVQTPSSAPATGIRGAKPPHPIVLKPAFQDAVFRSSLGGTTTLAKLQKGHLMLLYFGYTSCPDVCPTTMSDLHLALQQLPALTQAHTQVVFVTSDPAYDTTARMKTWLSHFDGGGAQLPFVGLTASLKQIDSVAKSVGVPLSPPVVEKDGSISVEHGAQTLAFVGGKASVLWLAGTTPADYAHDIGLLIPQVKGSP